MNIEKVYNLLKDILPEDKILINEIMKKHISFKVGGPADIFINIENIEILKKVLIIIKENNIPFRIIGNGSNILVKDEGFRGIILKNSIKDFQILKNDNEVKLKIGAGEKLAIIGQKCLKNEFEGFEFATYIPGTLGGAIKMNAGAHKLEIKDIIENVTYMDLDGNIKTISNKDCEFEYRKSIFDRKKYYILGSTINLSKGNYENIKSKLDEYKKYRTEKQPIEFPNAGSTFKRGEDFITAKLIDDANLKGYKIGGAEVSTKHAGFIVNKDNATAKDIIDLADYVKKVIYEKFNKKINLEIEIL